MTDLLMTDKPQFRNKQATGERLVAQLREIIILFQRFEVGKAVQHRAERTLVIA